MFMDSSSSQTQSNSNLYARNGIFFLVFTLLLFLLLIISIFLHTFRHSCFPLRRRHRRRLPAANKGLHPSLLASLPTFTHAPSSPSAGAGDSCAVCMSEFVAGDEGRVLPICRHSFHSQCIDAWFGSHLSCPLCRTPVQPVQPGPVAVKPEVDKWFPEPIWCPKKKPLKMELELEKLEKSKNSYYINITL
ncbi:hypothetical protein PIB30_006050 [Stylosanthes scabra]|uniref:RING-type E3 ubiquitin transferase n=1 Tax=Stylosanthes scabra TaxID=79078 RepID=A0ABU6U6V1_9FABA|nr:hypothetical protein [Stylosanthes scabra]